MAVGVEYGPGPTAVGDRIVLLHPEIAEVVNFQSCVSRHRLGNRHLLVPLACVPAIVGILGLRQLALYQPLQVVWRYRTPLDVAANQLLQRAILRVALNLIGISRAEIEPVAVHGTYRPQTERRRGDGDERLFAVDMTLDELLGSGEDPDRVRKRTARRKGLELLVVPPRSV